MLTDVLFASLTSGVDVPDLSNKNSLERQLPQVKLHHCADSPLLSVSAEIFCIYFGKNLNNCCYVRLKLPQTIEADLSL